MKTLQIITILALTLLASSSLLRFRDDDMSELSLKKLFKKEQKENFWLGEKGKTKEQMLAFIDKCALVENANPKFYKQVALFKTVLKKTKNNEERQLELIEGFYQTLINSTDEENKTKEEDLGVEAFNISYYNGKISKYYEILEFKLGSHPEKAKEFTSLLNDFEEKSYNQFENTKSVNPEERSKILKEYYDNLRSFVNSIK
jgi:hypothetical protein